MNKIWLIYARNRSATIPQEIERVKWRQAVDQSNSLPQWVSDEQIASVDQVVKALRNGEGIGTVFETEGHRVLGPRVVIKIDAGREKIETEPWSIPGSRSLFDLPEFD